MSLYDPAANGASVVPPDKFVCLPYWCYKWYKTENYNCRLVSIVITYIHILSKSVQLFSSWIIPCVHSFTHVQRTCNKCSWVQSYIFFSELCENVLLVLYSIPTEVNFLVLLHIMFPCWMLCVLQLHYMLHKLLMFSPQFSENASVMQVYKHFIITVTVCTITLYYLLRLTYFGSFSYHQCTVACCYNTHTP